MTLRITGGTDSGRLLRSLRGFDVRPTSAKVRQALFNILRDRTQGGHWLDLFAGCGTVGLEALSRGAQSVVFVEQARAALLALQQNLRACGWEDRAQIVQADVLEFLRRPPTRTIDIAFLDPPYSAGLYERAISALLGPRWLRSGALVIVETGQHAAEPAVPESLQRLSGHRYGSTSLTIYTVSRSS